MNIDFLVVHYKEFDFLINREQFSSSLFLEEEIRIRSPLVYISSVTTYKEQHVLVLDLNRYFEERFECTGDESSQLILIMDTNNFSVEGKRVFDKLKFKNSEIKVSTGLLALKVANNTDLLSFSLLDLRLMPPAVRKLQYDYGILGVRFPDNMSAQLFVDTERIFINNITKRSFRSDYKTPVREHAKA